jgi:hypothetical protein
VIVRSIQGDGPGAAATATRTEIAAPEEPTGSDNPTPVAQQSAFGSSEADNTGREQATRRRIDRVSLRTAIDAMCRSCIYDPGGANGTWREQVQGCSSGNCPLHPVRPITVKAQKRDADARHAVARAFGPPGSEAPSSDGRLALNGLIAEQRRAA